MADEQGNKNIVDSKIPKIDLPESFDSWTVITGSMSKPNETESTTKSNENENKLHENDPEPSTSGVESLEKDEIDSPSENNLENTDELSDGISIIEEDSDSLGRHTPLNMFSNEDYHINYNMYASEKFNKSTLTNSNENIVDSRSNKSGLNFRNGISGFFIISVFFALLAFFAKIKYPEWNETGSINERIIDLELQNNLLRAELDILSKELNYIRNKDNHNQFHEKKHYKDKINQEIKYRDRNSNFHEDENFEDKIDQDKKNHVHKEDQGKRNHEHKVDQGKKNHEEKIKVWPGGGDIQETEIDKEGLKRHYVSLHDLLEVTPMKEEKEEKEEGFSLRRALNIDYSSSTYPEYVDDLLRYFDYNIDYANTNIFSIDRSTYDRLVKLLRSRNIEIPTKSQYQKLVDNYRDLKSACVSTDERVERFEASEADRMLRERRNSATRFQTHLRSLSMQELRDLFVNSPDPEVQVTAQLILREKINEVKYHYNILYQRKKKKITKEPSQSKEETEPKKKKSDTSKDKIHSNKNTKEDKPYKDKHESREQHESKENSNDASRERGHDNKHSKEDKQYKDKHESREQHQSQENSNDASRNRVHNNKHSKEDKQYKDKHESREQYESQGKRNDSSNNRVDHNKNAKDIKQSKEKRESREKDYNGSKNSIHQNKNENSKDKNVPKKDWHDKLMKERENIRNDRRKKNWYSERGHAREQARTMYKYKEK